MTKQYSVFISATSEDLQEYRQAARDAVLMAGMRPEMMEYFGASGRPPLAECLARLSDCDLVIVLVARRYGWIPSHSSNPEEKSITWLECEHAVALGKELLVFLLDERTLWPVEFTESFCPSAAANETADSALSEDVERRVKKLAEFRTWLESSRTRSVFTSPEELRSLALLSLYRWRDRDREDVPPGAIKAIADVGGLALQGYKIFQRFSLNHYSHGVDGTIQILIDERIVGLTGAIRNDPYSGIGILHIQVDSQNWSLDRTEVKPALLLITDEHNRVVYSEWLERESARLDRVFLRSDKSRQTFIVTRDYSIGWGSYNGPVSYFLEVTPTGIRYIFPHGLMTSLKSAWAIAYQSAALDSDSIEVIYQKCRPNFVEIEHQDLAFQTTYERFYLAGDVWKSERLTETLFWEHERPLVYSEFREKFSVGKVL